MHPLLLRPIDWLLLRTRLALLPVKVRRGIARGATWSLYPWMSYWRGTHEPVIQELIADYWDWTGKHCWDLGSHYGLYAVGLGRLVGPTGTVAAFEPNPICYARLQLHVRRNRLSWVQTFRCAVSDQASVERLIVYERLHASTAHFRYVGEPWYDGIPTISVETCRLDDLVADLRIAAPDFIKLDVEGHGHRALAGAREAIAQKLPPIIAGLHSQTEVDGVLAILQPLGYIWRFADGQRGLGGSLVLRDVFFIPPPR